MNTSLQEVQTYYDEHVAGKLKDFISGNARVEKAWLTVEQQSPKNPQRILEVGCGIGSICWRMNNSWPEAEVVGLDVSSKSLEIAQKLFGSSKLSFVEGPLAKGAIADKFDLIVLMDVYEHIQIADRPELHKALGDLLRDGGRIILAFPTPRHQAWLRQHRPDQLQPVDEDISLNTILELARNTDTEVLLYQEVNVWRECDYAHAVLGRREEQSFSNTYLPERGIKAIISKLQLSKIKSQRISLIHNKLGLEYSPNK